MIETHLPVQPADRDASVQALLQYAPSTPHLNPSGLVIRDAAQGSGRGLYASRPLSAGTILEISPVLLFPPQEYHTYGRFTQLDGYTFVWKRTSVGSVMALALGLGSLFNHSTQPNVNYTLDHERQCIRYTLIKHVDEGDELCISYGVGRMWWEKQETVKEKEIDDEGELRMLACVGAEGYLSHDEKDEHIQPEGNVTATAVTAVAASQPHQQPNGIDLHALAGPSRPISLAQPSQPTYPPLYRMTSAQDPRTLPLQTVPAWIVDISPRNSSLAVKYLQKHSTLQSRDDGLFSTRHLRSFKTEKRKVEGSERQETLISFLVCLRDAMPDRDEVVALLSDAPNDAFAPRDASAEDKQSRPYLLDVPSAAAPSKARLAEWTTVWPCIVRSGSSFSPNAGGPTVAPGTTSVGTVNRAAEEAIWTADDARLRWALNRFRRVVTLARRAKENGEVPIAVHVTHPLEESMEWGKGWKEREAKNWSLVENDDVEVPSIGRGKATSSFAPQQLIEVDATDSRISLRNPLKHAIVQAIAQVAHQRSIDRRSHITSQSNGSEYLLTNLVLFTTHEPCVYCSMALVHSRVKAVFFLLPSPGRGGCCGAQLKKQARCHGGADGGVYAIQEQRGLNHAFHVWRWMHDSLSTEREDKEDASIRRIKVDLDVGNLDP